MKKTLRQKRGWSTGTVLLVVLAGCNTTAGFRSCFVPEITFSGGDAAAQPQLTSAQVPVTPQFPSRPATAETPDDTATEAPPSPPQDTYYRVPALPEQASSAPASSPVGSVAQTGAPRGVAAAGSGSASVAAAQAGVDGGAMSSGGTPPYSALPQSSEVVVMPAYGGYGGDYGDRGTTARGPGEMPRGTGEPPLPQQPPAPVQIQAPGVLAPETRGPQPPAPISNYRGGPAVLPPPPGPQPVPGR